MKANNMTQPSSKAAALIDTWAHEWPDCPDDFKDTEAYLRLLDDLIQFYKQAYAEGYNVCAMKNNDWSK